MIEYLLGNSKEQLIVLQVKTLYLLEGAINQGKAITAGATASVSYRSLGNAQI